MSWWDAKAARLQDSVRASEIRSADFSQYGDDDVARAVVHTRRDVVLIVSHLSSLNSQLRIIKWLLAVIAIAASIVAYHVA